MSGEHGDTDGWMEYKRDVMHQLDFLTGEVRSLRDDIGGLDKDMISKLADVRQDIALIKQKASMWGGVWGAVASAVVAIIVQLVIHAITKGG